MGGLPAAWRSSGVSRPWSKALRIRWLSGASSRSRMSRSTPVVSPMTSNLRLLAKLTSQVTDQARKPAYAIGQRPHPAGQHFMMQSAGNVLTATRKLLDRLHRLPQALQILGGLRPGSGQQLMLGRRKRNNPGSRAGLQEAATIPGVLSAFLSVAREIQRAAAAGGSVPMPRPPSPLAASSFRPSPAPRGHVPGLSPPSLPQAAHGLVFLPIERELERHGRLGARDRALLVFTGTHGERDRRFQCRWTKEDQTGFPDATA